MGRVNGVLLDAPGDGVGDGPGADALAVELQRIAQQCEAAMERAPRIRVLHQLRAAVPDQRRAVEGGLGDQRLGVDGQPAAGAPQQA